MSSSKLYDRLHELFEYNMLTGELVRRVARGTQSAGTIVGCSTSFGHLMVGVDGTNYLVHRLIWLMQTGEWPTGFIDHIDQNPANNAWENLRDTTRSINQQNSSRLPAHNTSGYRGVCCYKNLWRAQITVRIKGKRKTHWLGDYATAEEAAAAYQAAKDVYHIGAIKFTNYFDCVKQFHYKVLGVYDTKPTLQLPVKFQQRVAFMEEEIEELGQAYSAKDLVGVADALADLVYVALGTAHMMGIDFDQVFKVVHAANMRKMRGMTKRGMVFDACKPEGWVGPEAEIKVILDATKS